MRASPFFAVLLLSWSSACVGGASGARDVDAARGAESPEAWFATARVAYDPGNPREAMTPKLVGAFADARIVGIGEATHGTHEDVWFKSELVLALVDAGLVDTIYLEANHSGVAQLDELVRSGAGDARDALKAAPIFRVLKTEAVLACVEGLRERARRGVRVRLVGVDCQDSTRDAERALRILGRRDVALAAMFRAKLEPLVGAEAQALRHPQLVRGMDVAALDALSDELARLQAACADAPEAAAAALRAWQGLKAFRIEARDAPREDDIDGYNLRDRYMAQNVLADGHRGAFLGHNCHVLAGRPGGNLEGYVPAGAVLHEALGERYRVVLFDYNSARIRAVPMPTDGSPPDALAADEILARGPLEGSLADATCRGAEGAHWIDLRGLPPRWSAWHERVIHADWLGYAASRERQGQEVLSFPFARLGDVLVVIDELGASRPLE